MLAIWALVAIVGVEVVVTYSRLPPADLYHVRHHGIANGLSRFVTYLNWPVSVIAIATLPVAYAARPTRARLALAIGAAALCAATFVPGVVQQADLDTRPINAIAVVGVVLAVLLSVGPPARFLWRRSDAWRLTATALLLLVGLPWIAADLGFSFDGVPVLGQIFQTGELRYQPGVEGLHAAVHHGHHHGMDGILLAFGGLLMLRTRPGWIGRLYASFILAWGLGNVVNDAWLEQIVKRGWTSVEVPGVLSATPDWTWLAVLVGAAAIFVYSSRTRASSHSDIGT